MSRLQKVDLVSFYFLSHFYFLFNLFFIFLFLELWGQGLKRSVTLSHLMVQSQYRSWDLREGSRKFWNKMTLYIYNIDTTCWPHARHMVIQGRMHSTQHGPSVGVYKVDCFVKSFLLSSLVLLNIRLPLNPTLRVLSYNSIGFTQDNSIEFQVQSIYLIYARLIVYTTQI